MDCSISWCNRPIKSSGYCSAHHARKLRGTDLEKPFRSAPGSARGICSVRACELEADSAMPGGVCAVHRSRMAKTGTYYKFRQRATGLECSITGCHSARVATTLCGTHRTKSITYNLSALQLNALYLPGECESCSKKIALSQGNIDHDHSCCSGPYSCGLCVRGMLCSQCNLGLGAFQDDVNKLAAAIAYLQK